MIDPSASRVEQPMPPLAAGDPAYKWPERLSPWLFYAPVVFWSLRCAIRHRSLRAPLAVNTAFPAGGLSGESKLRVLDQIGGESRSLVARYVGLERRPVASRLDLPRALDAMEGAGLAFPLIAKPDLGTRGAGVRMIADEAGLLAYIEAFPVWEQIVLQRYAPGPGEAGIFYIRPPGAEAGFLFSLSLKYFPDVVGDGRKTLRKLIADHPRGGRLGAIYAARSPRALERIVAEGERVPLATIGNRGRGAQFRDGRALITEAMSARFDAVARDIPGFHFGRFDIRFASLDALRDGRDFTIVEVNGAGSEATHVWDARIGLRRMYGDLFEQIDWLWSIGAANRRNGSQAEPLGRWIAMLLHEKSLIGRYPRAD